VFIKAVRFRSDNELKVLQELLAIQVITEDIQVSLRELITNTKPGGRLYDSQERAIASVQVWERFFVPGVTSQPAAQTTTTQKRRLESAASAGTLEPSMLSDD